MIFKTESGRVSKKILGSGSGSRTRCLDTYPQPLDLANLTLFAKVVETLQKPWNIGSSKTHSQQKGKVETSPRPSGLFLTLHPVSNASSRGNKSKCLVSQINCKYFLFRKIERTRIFVSHRLDCKFLCFQEMKGKLQTEIIAWSNSWIPEKALCQNL